MKQNIRKLLIVLCVVIFVVNALWISNVFSQPIKIICSTDNPKGSLHVVALEKFGELVKKYSNGKLIAQIHYRGNNDFPAIRGEEVNMNAVMSGKRIPREKMRIHVTVIAAGNASQKAEIIQFLMLPYIFPDILSAKKLFLSNYMKRDINQILAKKHNVRALGWLIGGFRHMTNSKKPVKYLQAMKGLVIRTPQNRLMLDTYRAFGAKVKPLPWAKTFNALKEMTVDGQENPYNVIFTSKFWDANQKYVTNNGPFLWVGPILINEKFYQSLPADFREIVDKAAGESSKYEWEWVAKKNDSFKKALVKNGMQILDLEDKEEWIKVTRKLWKKYYNIIGYGDPQKGKAVVDEILKITTM